MSGSSQGLRIADVPQQQRGHALELVFGYVEPADRQRQIDEIFAFQRDGATLGGLIGAWRGDRLVGAMFSQTQPGKTAVVWLPRLVDGETASTAPALLAASWKFLESQRVVLAHVLLENVDPADEALVRQAGFDFLADLLYLVSTSDVFPTTLSATGLDFEPYRETEHARLARIVEATYEATLDCPGLEGVRNADDALAGYRATGVFDPSRWLIARHGQGDVGCLLLADQPRQENMELVYMGVIATARGQGWGKQLAHHAQWLARLAGRARLVLAVDSRNMPAIQTYAAVGFRAWQRRRLYVRQFSNA